MKNFLLALFAVVFLSTTSFAQAASADTSKTSAPAVTKTVTGKVESVTLGNTAKKIKPGITILDEQGQKIVVGVKASTVIADKDGKKVELAAVKKEAKVNVVYKVKAGGSPKAQTIKMLE